jgi:hypothetical protein
MRITVCLQGRAVSTPIPASTSQKVNAFREIPRFTNDLSLFGKFYRVVNQTAEQLLQLFVVRAATGNLESRLYWRAFGL